MTKSYIAPGFTQLTPYLTVNDPDKSIDFYQKAFGFTLSTEDCMKDDDGKTQHAHMKMETVQIMFGREGSFDIPNLSPKSAKTLPGAVFYVYCADADAQFKQAVSNGAKAILEPQDMFWGDRMCKVADIDGYEWSFATFKGE